MRLGILLLFALSACATSAPEPVPYWKVERDEAMARCADQAISARAMETCMSTRTPFHFFWNKDCPPNPNGAAPTQVQLRDARCYVGEVVTGG
jgi:hypothetical protein